MPFLLMIGILSISVCLVKAHGRGRTGSPIIPHLYRLDAEDRKEKSSLPHSFVTASGHKQSGVMRLLNTSLRLILRSGLSPLGSCELDVSSIVGNSLWLNALNLKETPSIPSTLDDKWLYFSPYKMEITPFIIFLREELLEARWRPTYLVNSFQQNCG